MKRIIAVLLALILLFSVAACGSNDASIKDAIKKFKMLNNLPAASDTVEQVPEEEPAVEYVEEFAGDHSYQLEDFFGDSIYTVSFTLPENMWVVDQGSSTLYIYNVASPDETHSAAPRIQFEIKEAGQVDSYMDSATELTELDSRTIGGIEIQGRYYKLWGMYWTEYYGELPDGYWMTVKISDVSIDPGSDGSNILDSVIFE